MNLLLLFILIFSDKAISKDKIDRDGKIFPMEKDYWMVPYKYDEEKIINKKKEIKAKLLDLSFDEKSCSMKFFIINEDFNGIILKAYNIENFKICKDIDKKEKIFFIDQGTSKFRFSPKIDYIKSKNNHYSFLKQENFFYVFNSIVKKHN